MLLIVKCKTPGLVQFQSLAQYVLWQFFLAILTNFRRKKLAICLKAEVKFTFSCLNDLNMHQKVFFSQKEHNIDPLVFKLFVQQ
jgi:hypothetical protein